MRFRGLAAAVVLLMPAILSAQKREYMELQRDVALLQQEVRSGNEKIASLAAAVEQVLDRVNSANTSVAVLDKNVRDGLDQQQKQLAAPIATLASKVDRMADEFRFVRESVSDLNSRVNKLQAQLTDLRNAMQVMAAPPPPPGAAPGAAAPPASAQELFNSARRDQSGGKPELALAQYEEFLKLFPNSDLAPAAQHNIGEIYYGQGEFEAARKAFDLVLEKYPENERTPDAMYMKAMSLGRAKDLRSAAREFRSLIQKYPDSDLAQKSREELKKMGY